MLYHVYILRNHAGKLYIGQTQDIERRLEEHNSTGHGYTAKFRPWELIYSEACETRQEAMAREKVLKSGTGRDWIKNNLGG